MSNLGKRRACDQQSVLNVKSDEQVYPRCISWWQPKAHQISALSRQEEILQDPGSKRYEYVRDQIQLFCDPEVSVEAAAVLRQEI